ncbi:unnamed protein product [Cuscuta campestris]|uniref:Uncharacterized protein n=1 Tax=Cuscuta campestris TaxID=132261 RepID=A0A484M0Z4_9ASTE|nr:unnamed protein product [Cuscuta campestris]
MTASIEDLSHDLLEEILHRLSYKESRGCLCVCTTWLLSVSQPSFLKRLMTFNRLNNQVQQEPYLILNLTDQKNYMSNEFGGGRCFDQEEEDKDSKARVLNRSLDFLPKREGEVMRVLRVSGDLFLCGHSKKRSCPPKRAHSGDGKDYYYVCNPITRQWVALPPRSCAYGSNFQFYSPTNFYEEDPHDSIYNPEYEYNVLIMVDEMPSNNRSRSSVNVESFSSKVGKWRTLALSIPRGFYFRHRFWLQESCLHEGILWYCNIRHIIKYNIKDLEQEPVLFDIPLGFIDSDVRCVAIGVCRGRLRLAGLFPPPDNEDGVTSDLMVWDLDEEEDGWRKWASVHMFSLSDMCLNTALKPDQVSVKDICVHPTNPDIVFVEHKQGIVECNTRMRVFKHMQRAAMRYTASKERIFLVTPPSYPTPVLPLNNNMQEENCFYDPPVLPVVTSVWEQVDFFSALRKDTQVV